MFEVSFPELVILAVVALLVLGPERLPRAARFLGLWVRKARAQWFAVKSEFERELAAEDLKRSLQQAREAMEDAGADLGRHAGEADTALRDTARELEHAARIGERVPSKHAPAPQPHVSPAREAEAAAEPGPPEAGATARQPATRNDP